MRHVILDRAGGTIARCDCGREFRLPVGKLEAGVIKCANCGANPPADANHCPYCDAHLTTLRCGRCLAQSIKGDQHCRACGHLLVTPVHRLRPEPEKVLSCPRCQHSLNAVMAGDALLDECTRCGGVWLEHDVFKEILSNERDQELLFAALAELVPLTPGSERQQVESEGRFYVPCPQCQTTMDRRQFARVSGVVIDVCKPHGIWFDHDELPGIVRFVGAGGMELAAKKLHQKRVAELKRAQRKTSQTASMFGGASVTHGSFAALDVVGVFAAIVYALIE